MSLQMLRDGLTDYQRAIRKTKSQYLSNIISSSGNCPKVLFDTINAVLNPCTSAVAVVSMVACENFLNYFVDKVESARRDSSKNSTLNADTALLVAPTNSAVFDQLDLVSLSSLGDIVQSLKPTNGPLDIVPSKILKTAFNTVGPSFLP